MYDRPRKSPLSCDRSSTNLKRIMQSACIFALLFVHADGLLSSSEPLVNTKWGLIRGKWSKSKGGRAVANFLGIPYAIPPIGDLRFRNPQRWNRTWIVRDAMVDGSRCFQRHRNTFSGSENCLYLNVYVPHISADQQGIANLPVLFYVHGGGFNIGSSNSKMFSPTYLLDKDVILVTINYRLDVLGFFSTMTKVAPGNYGLKDVKMALEWVQENIRSFEGNPKSVTIMGHSAGAALVHLLALSYKTEGLFHKYILQSGSALSDWAVSTSKNHRQTGLRLARLVGCLPKRYECTTMPDEITEDPQKNSVLFNSISYTEEDDEEMMKCMKTIDAKKLVNMTHSHFHTWRKNPRVIFNPVLENESEDAIVTVNPIRALEKGRFPDIPAIVLAVKDEGLLKSIEFITNPVIKKEILKNFDELFPPIAESRKDPKDFNITAIKNFYFHENPISDSVQNLTNLISDYTITWPAFRAVKYQSKLGNSSLYLSFLGYEGTFSHTFASGNTTYFGVCHGDDLNYFFPILNYGFRNLMLHINKNDSIMIDIMTEMWINFATEGIPRASKVPEWPDYRKHQRFMRFGIDKSPDIVVQADFLSDRMEFWEKLMGDVPETEPIEYNQLTDPSPPEDMIMINGADTNSCKLIFYIILLIFTFY